MGVKPYAIATSVSLIIAQRLARRLCNTCKQIVDIPKEALLKEGFSDADVTAGIKIFGPKGCGNCTDGYKGRVGIYQVLPVTDAIAPHHPGARQRRGDRRPGDQGRRLGPAPAPAWKRSRMV